MVGRLMVILESLHAIAGDRFRWQEAHVADFGGVSALVVSPLDPGGASLRLTDTGISIYVEALGAAWEQDSIDHVPHPASDPPPFSSQLRWADETVRSVAEWGLVRVRHRFRPFGGETHLLRDASALSSWEDRADIKIVRRWNAW